MPFPWKKTKTNRISRIVADLQPPSRAASLVVETGFPTSVVDLFVKNRDRIKRHSLRKPKLKHSQSLAPPPTPSLSPDHSPSLPQHEAFLLTSPHGLHPLQPHFLLAHQEFNLLSAPPNADNISNANANAVNFNSASAVFVLAAKMFLVVISVLSTNKLPLGITISALLLFLIEILGKFAARNFLSASWIRNRFFPITALIDYGGEEQEAPSNSALNNEIQVVESNSEKVADEGLECESLGNRKKGLRDCFDVEVEKEEQGHFQVGIKNEISRSARLRAKIIKKLIPKKLRSGKRVKSNEKEKNKSKQEMGIMINENEQGIESSCEEAAEEIWEVHQMWKPEEEQEEIRSSMMMSKWDKEEEEEEEEEEDGKKSFECKIVILMILSGLCGGRFLALVLTISGCFMCKFIKILTQKWRFGKV